MRELALNVMDVAQNSISAKADLIRLTVEEDTTADRLTIRLEDNGCGMTPEQVKSVVDPFYTTRTTRKVGLGVPLFKMEAEMTGGSFSVWSQKGEGTALTAVFVPSHVDMIPLGDMAGTVRLLITCNPDLDFVYTRSRDGRSFTLDTRELRAVLGGEVALSEPEVSEWIASYLQEQTAVVEGGNEE